MDEWMDEWPKTIYSLGTFILAGQIMWNIRYTYHMMINIPSLETHRVVVVVVLVQLCCLTTFLQSTNVKNGVRQHLGTPFPPHPPPHVWKQEDGYDGGGP